MEPQKDWEWELDNAIVRPEALLAELDYLPADLRKALQSPPGLDIFITPYLLSVLKKETLNRNSYPICRQAIPSYHPHRPSPGWVNALYEDEYSPVDGLIHRYPNRALILTTDQCFIKCSFCFRQNTWKEGFSPQWVSIFAYLNKHTEINDVLLSGGDPLTLSNTALARIIDRVRALDHIKIIRISTRALLACPQRIDDGLLSVLDNYGPIWFGTQINHPTEITDEIPAITKRLIRSGSCLYNQSVLLRGINDDAEILADLFTKLVSIGIKPYYLHRFDYVPEAGYFHTPIMEGVNIMKILLKNLSGLAVPLHILDIPKKGAGKTLIMPSYVDENGRVKDYGGELVEEVL